jgi:hypothetical protein
MRPSRVRAWIVAGLLAFALLAAGGQITLRGWYAANPAYRAQVSALLEGRFALTATPDAVQFDYAWTEHGVQQVWGLGVALWQLPFELAGRAVGLSPFPDRVAMLAWLAVMFAAAIRAWWRRDEPWLAAGTVLIAGLLPPLVTVVRGRVGVYEEAAIYAYAAAIVLLAGTQRASDASSRARYLVLVASAGAAGLLRPTVWFYGFATAHRAHNEAGARSRFEQALSLNPTSRIARDGLRLYDQFNAIVLAFLDRHEP